jgi:Tol biopolymer transport system component
MVATFGVVLLILLFLSFVLEKKAPSGSSTAGSSSDGHVAYFEFGLTSDTLWLASISDPAKREAVLTASHAREFGVVPSVSPNGGAIAYTALPRSTDAPAPDAPADLWYASLTSRAEPQHIASDADLLVAPVWSPDAKGLVFRRSDATSYALVETSIDGKGAERILAMTASDYALFPLGYAPDGATFYHVTVSNDGTQLFSVDTESGSLRSVAELSGGLSRDWALSPDGTRLAFLALTYSADAITSRAYVMNLATAEMEPVTDAGVTAFSPVWDQKGALVIGTLSPDGESSFVKFENGSNSQTLGPKTGFDVPLAYLPGGAYLVQAFEGLSLSAPGRVSLTLIDANGKRHVLSRGDVTYAGWSAR